MRKLIWIVLIILLLAACQNDNNNTPNNEVDSVSDSTQVDVPRVEATPVPTATPIPTAQPLPTQALPAHIFPVATRTIHIVEPGDTLTVIAKKYSVTIKAISDANRHYDFDLIKVGDMLYIPPCE